MLRIQLRTFSKAFRRGVSILAIAALYACSGTTDISSESQSDTTSSTASSSSVAPVSSVTASSTPASFADADNDGVPDNGQDTCLGTASQDRLLVDAAGCSAFQRGKASYTQEACAACHGADGSGGTFPPINNHSCPKKNIDCGNITKLAAYIGPEMPSGGGCDDKNGSTCATDVATFMVRAFAPGGSSVDSDGDGVSDNLDQCVSPADAEVGPTGCPVGVSPLASIAPITPQMRLTQYEFLGTIKKAFGVTELKETTLPSDTQDASKIFWNNADDNSDDFASLIAAIGVISEGLAASLEGRCNWKANTRQCFNQHLSHPLKTLHRVESVPEADAKMIVKVMNNAFNAGAAQKLALIAAISTMLADERFIYKMENGQENTSDLTDNEFAVRLAYLLTDLPPNQEVLDNPYNVEAHTQNMLSSDEYHEVVWQFVAQMFNLPLEQPPQEVSLSIEPLMGDQCNTTPQCQAHFKDIGAQSYDCAGSASDSSVCLCDGDECNSKIPAGAAKINASAYEETRRFVRHVFSESNAPISALFSANYSFINAELAAHYGVPAPVNDWDKVVFPDSAQRRGILTHASYLIASGGHKRNKNTIFRGKVVFERLFCQKMPNAGDADITAPITDRAAAPGCKGCHAIVDPIGRIFDLYDDDGKIFPGGAIEQGEVLGDVDITGAYDTAPELALQIAQSKTVSDCFTKNLYRFALGRDPVVSDQQSFELMRDTVEGDQTFNELMSAFTASDSFRKIYVKSKQTSCPAP
ncbi:DUF1592 domain-containing protein [Marinagarivorans algicola]|uniref:DUF1592 domain-containing protein n=1 Tax=Marinagarivorans algicola TaxID=1513270 RepID=UPI0006B8C595|nr:DUF1592 domain-containing protein [Marinagarivorans algicola]